MSTQAPRGVRLVITLAGRRNAGKSSLINAIAGQDIAIVSDTPGTTTDPVAKAYELLPLGPVTFYDTAGLDDEGDLGGLRMAATRKVLWRSDIVLLVVGESGIGSPEKELAAELAERGVPFLVVFNKADLTTPRAEDIAWCDAQGFRHSTVSAAAAPGPADNALARSNAATPDGRPESTVSSAADAGGINALKAAVIDAAPPEFLEDPVLVRDLVTAGDIVLCVVPIDLAAPKGRLILPQVQVLRDILDADAMGFVVKEHELQSALGSLARRPALVVTDSQVVLEVCRDVPDDIPVTTFSTLFARYKGDLPLLTEGARAIDDLRDGDRILMAEACSHHAVSDDIGRVKIPRWLRKYTGRDLHFEYYTGHDFPDDLEQYALCIHCGSCMLGRTEMLRRMRECHRRGVPIANYGVVISKVQGVLDRVIKPFGLKG